MKLHPLLCLLIGALASVASGASAAHSASGGSHAQRLRDSALTAGHSATLRRRLLQADGTGDVNVTVLFSGSIDASSKGRTIPPSFAGHSIEWDNPRKTRLTVADKLHISRLGNYSFSTMLDTPGYIPLLKLLANGNANGPFVIRMGGNSEDLVETFRTSTLQMLARLQKGLGVKFIIGLNFLQEQTQRLPVAQAKQVLKHLPQSSIIAFELGNEPDHYYNMKTDRNSFGRYLKRWNSVANALVPITSKKLAGPAWVQPNIPVANLTSMLNSKAKVMSLVTGHYYFNGAFVKGANYGQLLVERAVGNAVTKSLTSVAVSRKYSRNFRMAECNSFYDGGLAGGSDVFAASLWSLDLMLSLANVGVVGTDFHSYLKTPYNTLQRTQGADGEFLTVAKAPFYGQWVFQKAVAGGASIVPVAAADITENVKVWALKPKTGGLRLVVINKTAASGQAQFAVRGLPAGSAGKVFALTAPSITSSTGILFGGVTAEAAVAGAGPQFSDLAGRPAPDASGAVQYAVDVPAFYAALVMF